MKAFISKTTYKINLLLGKTLKINIRKKGNTFEEAQKYLIDLAKIDLLIDGGANIGQYAERIRRLYKGRLLCIEPIESNFIRLTNKFRKDKRFSAENLALGNKKDIKKIYQSNFDGISSSLYKPVRHIDYYPNVKFESVFNVNVGRLDTLNSAKDANSIYLKLDLQGYELIALEGATRLFSKINVIEVEVGFVHEMYANGAKFDQLISFLYRKNFSLYSISDFSRTQKGKVVYADVVFLKNSLLVNTNICW
jgi:FkbM family methyltransferase